MYDCESENNKERMKRRRRRRKQLQLEEKKRLLENNTTGSGTDSPKYSEVLKRSLSDIGEEGEQVEEEEEQQPPSLSTRSTSLPSSTSSTPTISFQDHPPMISPLDSSTVANSSSSSSLERKLSYSDALRREAVELVDVMPSDSQSTTTPTKPSPTNKTEQPLPTFIVSEGDVLKDHEGGEAEEEEGTDHEEEEEMVDGESSNDSCYAPDELKAFQRQLSGEDKPSVISWT